ncbi:DUF547 domain-containing protein [Spectribacter hydrogenoxidans]|uniref:DUF547 domain-containing protein n=1 Tax=Spectribacter hydrogenoxidans TaxID=3075608 RepID=A0ABU3BZU6_9GAMM|nr:DUF547 domain-containing protein [Salinisphaera sp. W335]MDT0634790.1 DUF547 domain-containing protein [Salinisphaera sp. W335]
MRIIGALLTCLLFPATTQAAPSADLWEHWTAHDENSTATIDHAAWSDFLRAHVVPDPALGLNRVRYGAVSPADRKALDTYIRRLENVAIADYSRPVQRAYWLNLYNAATVRLILEKYPVDSIRDIGGGLFGLGSNAWQQKLLTVDGKPLSLDDIEHRILRPIWGDGLTHYGVNCASVGCPNLRDSAYLGDRVNQQLRDNARAYVNSRRGARFDDGRLLVSKIYEWYQVDFGGSETGVISHLRRFAEPALSARLDAAEGIAGYRYDWSLNDAASAR